MCNKRVTSVCNGDVRMTTACHWAPTEGGVRAVKSAAQIPGFAPLQMSMTWLAARQEPRRIVLDRAVRGDVPVVYRGGAAGLDRGLENSYLR